MAGKTLQQKIRLLPAIATFALLGTFAVIVGVGALLVADAARLRQHYYPSVQLSQAVRQDLVRMQRGLQDAAAARDPALVAAADRVHDSLHVRIREARKAGLSDTRDLDRIAGSIDQYYDLARSVTRRLADGTFDEATVAPVAEMKRRFNDLRGALDVLVERDQSRIDAAFSRARSLQLVVVIAVGATALASLIVLWLLSAYTATELTRSLTAPLGHAVAAMESIAKGDVAVAIPRDVEGEMGQLLAAMRGMVEYLNEMAAASRRIALGDVTAEVAPHGPADAFGQSFQGMTAYLREMADVADGVAAGNLAATITPRSEGDRFGRALNSMVRTLAQAFDGLATSEARFRSLVQNSSDLTIVIDPDMHVRYASPSIERDYGHAPEAVAGIRLLQLLHPDDGDVVLGAFAGGASTSFVVRCRLRRGDGEWRYLECVGADLRSNPAIDGFVLNARDITDRVELEARLTYQAFHDPLTGLANRALFRDRVEHALARATREGGVQPAVLFLDLDDFKGVNDTLGHAAGDRLLCAVADRLLNATRGCDTVARLGGDEFAVLLEQVHADGEATIVANRILGALVDPVSLRDEASGAPENDAAQHARVSASIGVARATLGDDSDVLLRNADVAMYHAKRLGKGTYEIFVPSMYAALMARRELESELHSAIETGNGIHVVYQEIVDLDTGAASAVEALVRWDHPTRGSVPPSVFIPIAEESGLILPLGRRVLREACREVAGWTLGLDRAVLGVAVNLSARQLQSQSLIDEVAIALRESGLSAGRLTLEITETVIMEDTEATLLQLRALKKLGVRLAIDDFGTGYSSLGYLQRFPVDTLKIDKRFVEGLRRGETGTVLARTVIALGETLGLDTVAEGIEHREQLEHLRQLGCRRGQGYLFSRPMPAKALLARLARSGASGEAADPSLAGVSSTRPGES